MTKYKMWNFPFIISEKLKTSMERRLRESATGRVIVPTDIIRRIEKQNLDKEFVYMDRNIKRKIHDFCIAVYNGVELDEYVEGKND